MHFGEVVLHLIRIRDDLTILTKRSPLIRLLLASFFIPLFMPISAVSTNGAGEEAPPTWRDTVLTVRPGDSLAGIAARFLGRSPSYTRPDLVDEIRRGNGLASDTLRPGQRLRVPLRARLPRNQTIVRPADFAARGIYLTAQVAGRVQGLELIDRLVAAGGNAVVFDVKNRLGELGYVSQVPLAVAVGASEQAPIQQPAKLIEFLHRRGVHAVARFVCFHDTRLARQRPDLVPLSRKNGGLWAEREEPAWVDPSLPEVQEYLLALIEEVAGMGVDEIQLDYIRFPTEGDDEDAVFAFDPEVLPKHRVITDFLARVKQRLAPTGVLLSADVFGVIIWGQEADVASTGQRLTDMLPHLDIISPMLYPSHFYGSFAGLAHPVDCPYFVMHRGCSKLRQLAVAHGVAVRPWIQAFPYRVSDFDEQYVAEQLHGAEDAGAQGWLLWNAAGRYEVGMETLSRFSQAVPEEAPRRRNPNCEPGAADGDTAGDCCGDTLWVLRGEAKE